MRKLKVQSSRFKVLALACSLAMVLSNPIRAADQEPPFTGIVTADKVNVRAGAGDTYYPVMTVDRGARVRVLKNLYGWYEIQPPEGAFSYIAKDEVKLDPGAHSGLVTLTDPSKKRANVRAPSPNGADAGASFKIQYQLEKGAPVKVLGEAGDFYKIIPPQGATLWVHKDFVRPATEEELKSPPPSVAKVPPTAAQAPAPKPAETAAKPEPTPPAPVAQSPKPEPATKTKPAAEPGKPAEKPAAHELAVQVKEDGSIVVDGATLKDEELSDRIDKALVDHPDLKVVVRTDKKASPEAVKSILDRVQTTGVKDVSVVPIEAVAGEPAKEIEPAEPAAAGPPRLEDLERRYAQTRKTTLAQQPLSELLMDYEELAAHGSLDATQQALVKARIEVLKYRRELQSHLTDVSAFKQQLDLARQEREEAQRRRPKSYTAVGRLQSSTLYTGQKLPLLYRIADPSTGLTIAYVQPPHDEDYTALVGQYVGVLGDKEYDASIKLQVIKSKGVDVLKPQQ